MLQELSAREDIGRDRIMEMEQKLSNEFSELSEQNKSLRKLLNERQQSFLKSSAEFDEERIRMKRDIDKLTRLLREVSHTLDYSNFGVASLDQSVTTKTNDTKAYNLQSEHHNNELGTFFEDDIAGQTSNEAWGILDENDRLNQSVEAMLFYGSKDDHDSSYLQTSNTKVQDETRQEKSVSRLSNQTASNVTEDEGLNLLIDAVNEKLRSVYQLISSLKASLDAEVKNKEDVFTELQQVYNRQHELESELELKKQEVILMRKQKESAHVEITSLAEEKAQMTGLLERYMTELTVKREELRRRIQEIASLREAATNTTLLSEKREEIEKLEQEKEAITQELSEARKTLRSLSEKNDELSLQLAQLSLTNETLNKQIQLVRDSYVPVAKSKNAEKTDERSTEEGYSSSTSVSSTSSQKLEKEIERLLQEDDTRSLADSEGSPIPSSKQSATGLKSSQHNTAFYFDSLSRAKKEIQRLREEIELGEERMERQIEEQRRVEEKNYENICLIQDLLHELLNQETLIDSLLAQNAPFSVDKRECEMEGGNTGEDELMKDSLNITQLKMKREHLTTKAGEWFAKSEKIMEWNQRAYSTLLRSCVSFDLGIKRREHAGSDVTAVEIAQSCWQKTTAAVDAAENGRTAHSVDYIHLILARDAQMLADRKAHLLKEREKRERKEPQTTFETDQPTTAITSEQVVKSPHITSRHQINEEVELETTEEVPSKAESETQQPSPQPQQETEPEQESKSIHQQQEPGLSHSSTTITTPTTALMPGRERRLYLQQAVIENLVNQKVELSRKLETSLSSTTLPSMPSATELARKSSNRSLSPFPFDGRSGIF
eukprot:TRINITY_DN1785_c0_g1_i1.p1 TRINITY_DN1785_c0_g1~~TRINITY_DN1785_c0_g1_i1.p1  ORF type:complete len:846 (-),score=213.79 TRINITY_DN1785_c0_g1_i1:25-2529(-)